MMRIKLSATFQGKCDLCGKEGKVFKVGDEDTKISLTICEECAKKYKDRKVSEMIKEFGKKDEEAFKDTGIKVFKKEKRMDA